jgi:hypothetical protein
MNRPTIPTPTSKGVIDVDRKNAIPTAVLEFNATIFKAAKEAIPVTATTAPCVLSGRNVHLVSLSLV